MDVKKSPPWTYRVTIPTCISITKRAFFACVSDIDFPFCNSEESKALSYNKHSAQEQQNAAERENGEPQIVEPHESKQIREAPECDHQRGSQHHISQEHPQQIVGLTGCQWIDADTVKDGRQ